MADPITEEMLLNAVRKRLLQELEREQQASSGVINNIYGGGLTGPSRGGVFNQMADATTDPGLYDYMVDIKRRDVLDPESGEPIGWDKNVHRYRKKKA